MKTNKNGISLIVLVVTIIVLAILAATVIIAIVNTGVINSAKDAAEAQKLGQVRDIATVAWEEALIDPNVSTPGEYLNHIVGFLKGEGYTDEELDKYTIVADVNGVTVNLKDTEYAGLTITKDTEGATFTKSDGVTPGDPDNLEAGDIVIYGDYEYRYNMHPVTAVVPLNGWVADNELNGWHVVRHNTDLISAGELCGTIYGKPLVSMQYTFFGCQKLVSAPAIPKGVTNMIGTFYFCSSLTESPVIPDGVTTMEKMFYLCTSLIKAPAIPKGVTNMYSTFYLCSSLAEARDMSRATNVTNMERTFYGCSSLTEAPVIPSSVTNMEETFFGCTSLTEGPDMSRATSVTNMESTFIGCSSLAEAPIIPNSVTNMNGTFSNCENLTTAPVIPDSVTNMSTTFYKCTKLNGIVQINSSIVDEIDNCFYNTTNSLTVKVPVNSTTYTTVTTAPLGSNAVTIETFEPET